jgi:hypothetical protein
MQSRSQVPARRAYCYFREGSLNRGSCLRRGNSNNGWKRESEGSPKICNRAMGGIRSSSSSVNDGLGYCAYRHALSLWLSLVAV